MVKSEAFYFARNLAFEKFEGPGFNYGNSFFKLRIKIPKQGIFEPKTKVFFVLHETLHLEKIRGC